MRQPATLLLLLYGTLVWGETPKRIVSTSLASDEVLMEIMDGSERSHVVALSPLSTDERYSHLEKAKLKGVGVFDSSLESFVALKADLVILASFNKESLKDYVLKNKIRHLLLEDFATLADIKRNIIRVATAVGQRKKGREMLTELEERLAKIRANKGSRSKKPQARILTLDMGFSTMGKKTLFEDMVKTVGGVNLAANWSIDHWSKVSVEKILTDPPDLIVVGHHGGVLEKEIEWLLKSPLGALQNPPLKVRVCPIKSSSLLSTSQFVVQAVETLDGCVAKWAK